MLDHCRDRLIKTGRFKHIYNIYCIFPLALTAFNRFGYLISKHFLLIFKHTACFKLAFLIPLFFHYNTSISSMFSKQCLEFCLSSPTFPCRHFFCIVKIMKTQLSHYVQQDHSLLQQESPELLWACDRQDTGEVLAHIRSGFTLFLNQRGEDRQLLVEETVCITICQYQNLERV